MTSFTKSISSWFRGAFATLASSGEKPFFLTKEEAGRLHEDKDLQRKVMNAKKGNFWVEENGKRTAAHLPGQTKPSSKEPEFTKKQEEEIVAVLLAAVALGIHEGQKKAAAKKPQAKRVAITPAKKAPAPVAPPKGEDVTAARAMAKYLHPKNVQQHLANAAQELSEKSRQKNMHPLVEAAERMRIKSNS